MVEIPVLEAEAQVHLETRLELLLGMGVTVDQALELGLDLMCMDSLPGVVTLVSTQGNLSQLRRHIPPRPLDRNTDAGSPLCDKSAAGMSLLSLCRLAPRGVTEAAHSGRGQSKLETAYPCWVRT